MHQGKACTSKCEYSPGDFFWIHTNASKLKKSKRRPNIPFLPSFFQFMLDFCVRAHIIILYNNNNNSNKLMLFYCYNDAAKTHYIHAQPRQVRKLFWGHMPQDPPSTPCATAHVGLAC